MNCPPDIADALLTILRTGVLLARAAGWDGDASRAADEADHVHNLPDLLRDYSDDLLRYYWQAQRPAYLSRMQRTSDAGFDAAWNVIRAYLDPNRLAASA